MQEENLKNIDRAVPISRHKGVMIRHVTVPFCLDCDVVIRPFCFVMRLQFTFDPANTLAIYCFWTNWAYNLFPQRYNYTHDPQLW